MAEALADCCLVKAFRIGSAADIAAVAGYPAAAYLLDSRVAGRSGGTGTAFDWQLLRGVAWDRPVILAGGLNPGNVAQAVRKVRPYAVDTSSGVESAPGIKDAAKVQAFVAAARRALDGSATACS